MNSSVPGSVNLTKEKNIFATLVIIMLVIYPHFAFIIASTGRNPVTIDSYKNVCNYSDVLAPSNPALRATKFLFSRSRFLTNEE